MSNDVGLPQTAFDHLLGQLVADLRPVSRLRAPWLRAVTWLALVAVVATILSMRADFSALVSRLTATADMWLAVAGSSLTTILAAFATLQLALPDRSAAWALLPLPSLAIWTSASGMGCARSWLIPGVRPASLAETGHCLLFIASLSLPFSLVLLVMLRRGYSLHPSLTGATAGLAAAAAAATLLTFFHPFDVTFSDLLVHAIIITVVVAPEPIHRRTAVGT